MARLILIDSVTGYIFGDTADLPVHTFEDDDYSITQDMLNADANGAMLAARWLDETVVGESERIYEAVSYLAASETGYLVFCADVNGSDAVPAVWDGQDQDTINAVRASCKLVATVRCTNV